MRKSTLTKTLLGILLIASAASLQAQNAYLQNVSLPRYIKAGVNYPVSAWARNLSSTPLPWNTGTTINITAPGISSSSYVPYTHPVQLNTTQGPHTLVVEILSTNDSDPTNNTVTINFTALNNWADKVVLLEARTETWCPQCPPATRRPTHLWQIRTLP